MDEEQLSLRIKRGIGVLVVVQTVIELEAHDSAKWDIRNKADSHFSRLEVGTANFTQRFMGHNYTTFAASLGKRKATC